MRSIPLAECREVVIFGGGAIGVFNGLVARARGAGRITIMDVSQDRLNLHRKLGLPFDHWINSGETDPVEWIKDRTNGCGCDAVVVAASVPSLVPTAIEMLCHAGHLSIFAGMPKSDPVMPIDLNKIHYLELHVHGANSSVKRDYLEARDLIESGSIDVEPIITHTFGLDDFHEAVATQADPSSGSMKVVIAPGR
jgi:L-iditol 2-dehydrogenase